MEYRIINRVGYNPNQVTAMIELRGLSGVVTLESYKENDIYFVKLASPITAKITKTKDKYRTKIDCDFDNMKLLLVDKSIFVNVEEAEILGDKNGVYNLFRIKISSRIVITFIFIRDICTGIRIKAEPVFTTGTVEEMLQEFRERGLLET